jgi:hypothetical protein
VRASHASAPSAVGRAYAKFLKLPTALVLAVMWAAGAMVLCSGALALWLAAWALIRLVSGIP